MSIATNRSRGFVRFAFLPAVMLAATVMVRPALAQCTGPIAIERTSAGFLLASNGSDADAQYASYHVRNDGPDACTDVWVLITGLGDTYIFAGDNEDGNTRLNALAVGETKTAYFYLQVEPDVNADQPVESHDIEVYEQQPPALSGNGTLVSSASFDLIPTKAILANPHKIDSVKIAGDFELGGTFTVTIFGASATIGSDDLIVFAPATLPSWPSEDFQLVAAHFDIYEQGTTTIIASRDDSLFYPAAGLKKADFRGAFTFQVVGTPTGTTAINPLLYISSGTQNKHSTPPGASVTIPEPQQLLSITKGASKTILPFPGVGGTFAVKDTVTFTATLTNNGTGPVEIDDFIDTVCPTSLPCPNEPAYVIGTSTVTPPAPQTPDGVDPGDLSVDLVYATDPVNSPVLNWDLPPFSVGPGQSITVVYDVEFEDYDPNLVGIDDYDNCVVARIGLTEIGPACETINIVRLPVELVSFDAVVTDHDVLLKWTTASETNNAGFEVQSKSLRSDAGTAWSSVGFVEGAGTTDAPMAYAHRVSDLTPGTWSFRLKQVDYDGTFAFSQEIEVVVDLPGTHTLSDVYPNPFSDRAAFSLVVAEPQSVRVDLHDASGRKVKSLFEGIPTSNVSQKLEVDAQDLPAGIYFVRAYGETFTDVTQLVVTK